MIMSKRGKSPDMEINSETEAPNSTLDPALKSAAEDLLRAIESKSPIDVAKALEAAHAACENYDEPSEESEQEGQGEDNV